MTTAEANWAGNVTFSPALVHRPATLDELRMIVSMAPQIHALGSAHSFNDIANSAELISVAGLEPAIEVDRQAGTVTVGAAVRYGELAIALEREGLALHNMASLPHISVGGAVATATHGSGDRNGNLATAVAALDLVTSEGDVLHISRGDDDFAGMVVGLGAMGVVTRLTLDVQPSYQMRQQVFENLAWDVIFDQFDAVMGSADSVSLFTDFGNDIAQIWQKSRCDPGYVRRTHMEYHGARPATRNLHPVGTLPADGCTEQLDVPGAWADRLPHFRVDATPASGNELQSEYMVHREDAVSALQAVRELAPVFRPHLWISEIRTVTADDLWMSTAYQRETVCIHFSWRFDPQAVNGILPRIEAALAPFGARPHWGKIFVATASDIALRYDRMPDFQRLVERLDPRGAFRNPFLTRHLFGE